MGSCPELEPGLQTAGLGLFSGWGLLLPPLNNVKGLNWGSPSPSHCQFSFGLTPRKAFPRACLVQSLGPLEAGRPSGAERTSPLVGRGLGRMSACRGQCSSCCATASEPSSPAPARSCPPSPPPSLPDKPLLPSHVPLSHLHPCLALLTSKGPSQTAGPGSVLALNQFPPQVLHWDERVGHSGPAACGFLLYPEAYPRCFWPGLWAREP